ncbi:MAG TPA: DoxX family protein [Aggregatilineaceae bacterium]|nr:DoxX family protein [Aggregatilineaceae bacterium]
MDERRLIERTPLETPFDRVDRVITTWMAEHGLTFLRIGLGLVFFWFGALKLFPDASPAEDLVRDTTSFVDPDWFIPLLAFWEMAIGIGLIFKIFMRVTLLLLFLQMPGTALPLIVKPDAVWTHFPFALTLEGQYIIKNLVLVAAGIVLGGTVRGGRIDPEPDGTVTPS